MKTDTTSEAFFEQMYRQNPDPWDFASSGYEQSRYEAIFTLLNDRRYSHAFEPGCSIGILTARLAPICDRVDAMDISTTAVKLAQERCRSLPNVKITLGALPQGLPAGGFDLIVLSEIGYYFDERQLLTLGNDLVTRLRKPGVLLGAHWLGDSDDHLLSGERVQEILGTIKGLIHISGECHAAFRLDRWERR